MPKDKGFIDKPYFSWDSKDNDIRAGRSPIRNGRVTIAELLMWISENIPQTSYKEIELSGGMVTWQREANEVELAERDAHRKVAEERHNEWEYATYERLRAKFEK